MRSPANPSEVTRPAATSTLKACRMRSASKGTAAIRSLKNEAPRARRRSSTARASSVIPASDGVLVVGRRQPGIRVIADDERDRRHRGRLQHPRSRQARPSDFAREAQHVEHRGLVAVHPRRQHRALPRRRGHLEAVERFEDLAQTVGPRQARALLDVLPREQEAHEVGRGDRLDLGPQAVERVAVDAGEERAVAPFHVRRARRPA